MKLTQDQEQTLVDIKAWFDKPVKKTMESLLYLINGPAGSGKTTVVRMVIEELGLMKRSLAVTAPTHQAKKVIEKATSFRSSTIQKLLGLRPNVNIEDFDISNPQFDPISQETIGLYKVVIIDEGSMLNEDIVDLLIDKALSRGVRIIVLADSYQLPPVNEVMSTIFTKIPNISTLTTIIRQGNDNPNSLLLANLRLDIGNKNDNHLKALLSSTSLITNEKGFKLLDNKEFGQGLINNLRSTPYEHDLNYIRYLAWTNKSVGLWCEGVRRPLLGEKANNQINIGERMIGYSTIQNYKTKDILLQNSDVYDVIDVVEDESDYGFRGYVVTLRNEEDEDFVHFVVDNNDSEKFLKMAYEKWRAAKDASFQKRGMMWGIFFGFKDRHLTMRSFYYKGMNMSKDLYYAYGSTVHKSQGSTFTNTAVNLNDIRRNRTDEERRRLTYVALSRCTNTNLILCKK